MSTHAIRLVEISLTATEARRNAPVVTSWLLARGVITPNPDRRPSEFRAGPPVRCVACGRTSLVGDLAGRWSFHVGDLAVVFHNWPPLHEEFAADLGTVMGPAPAWSSNACERRPSRSSVKPGQNSCTARKFL